MFLLWESWLVDIFGCNFSSTAAKPPSASEAAAVLPAAHHCEALWGDVWHLPVSGSQQRGQSPEQHRPGWYWVLPEQLGPLLSLPNCPRLGQNWWPQVSGSTFGVTSSTFWFFEISKGYQFTFLALLLVAPLIIVEEHPFGKSIMVFVILIPVQSSS